MHARAQEEGAAGRAVDWGALGGALGVGAVGALAALLALRQRTGRDGRLNWAWLVISAVSLALGVIWVPTLLACFSVDVSIAVAVDAGWAVFALVASAGAATGGLLIARTYDTEDVARHIVGGVVLGAGAVAALVCGKRRT